MLHPIGLALRVMLRPIGLALRGGLFTPSGTHTGVIF